MKVTRLVQGKASTPCLRAGGVGQAPLYPMTGAKCIRFSAIFGLWAEKDAFPKFYWHQQFRTSPDMRNLPLSGIHFEGFRAIGSPFHLTQSKRRASPSRG